MVLRSRLLWVSVPLSSTSDEKTKFQIKFLSACFDIFSLGITCNSDACFTRFKSATATSCVIRRDRVSTSYRLTLEYKFVIQQSITQSELLLGWLYSSIFSTNDSKLLGFFFKMTSQSQIKCLNLLHLTL